MVLDQFRLDGHAAVVTGAGRGIGAATALAFAEAGADVCISARTGDQLRTVADRVEAFGRRALVVEADLADLDSVAGLADAAVEAFGRLDTVVNNVGGAMPRPFDRTKPHHLTDAFAFNVATAHALGRAAHPHLAASPNGSVVNISSMSGQRAVEGLAAYGTAKAALSHYTRLVSRDLAPEVRVNAVAPGAIATSALELILDDEQVVRTLEGATALGRLGQAEEIAAAVLFLASPAASYVTGQVLEVDGGSDPRL